MWDFLKARSTKRDVTTSLEYILEGRDYAWDFTNIVIRDATLDAIRLRVLDLETTHPPGPEDYYVNPEGQEIIRSIIRELQLNDSP